MCAAVGRIPEPVMKYCANSRGIKVNECFFSSQKIHLCPRSYFASLFFCDWRIDLSTKLPARSLGDYFVMVLDVDRQVRGKSIGAFGRAPSSARKAIDVGPKHRGRVIERK